ncbi:MAG: hypothetical protein ACREQK_09410, partial [Candidatus Binatia bacterium]
GMRKNKNRGYQQLRVWQDAIDYYGLSSRVFGSFPYQLSSVAYKLENELLKLIESLERKKLSGDWIDQLVVKESNGVYLR